MYWGDVFTSPLFFINFPAYKNYTLTWNKKDKSRTGKTRYDSFKKKNTPNNE